MTIQKRNRIVVLISALVIVIIMVFLLNNHDRHVRVNIEQSIVKQNIDNLIKQANSRNMDERKLAINKMRDLNLVDILIKNVENDNPLGDASAMALARMGEKKAIPAIKNSIETKERIQLYISLVYLGNDVDKNKKEVFKLFKVLLDKEDSSTWDNLIQGIDYLEGSVINEQDKVALETLTGIILKVDAAYSEELSMALASISLINKELFIDVLSRQNDKVCSQVISNLPTGLDFGIQGNKQEMQWLEKWQPFAEKQEGKNKEICGKLISAVKIKLQNRSGVKEKSK